MNSSYLVEVSAAVILINGTIEHFQENGPKEIYHCYMLSIVEHVKIGIVKENELNLITIQKLIEKVGPVGIPMVFVAHISIDISYYDYMRSSCMGRLIN